MRDISFKSRASNLLYASVAAGILVGLSLVFDKSNAARQSYAQLPLVDKATVKALIDDIAEAENDDLLVFKDGHVAIIRTAHKTEYYLEVRLKNSPSGHVSSFLFERWMVYRDIDRLVKQSDPEAGALALKFLKQ